MSLHALEEVCAKSPKAIRLCQSVCQLLEEGADVNAMKVSEITEKAGIGKGTAYEYFKSKEEMIANALLYGVVENLKEIDRRVDGCTGFREKYLAILDWLEEVFSGNGSMAIFCQVVTDSLQVSSDLKRVLGGRKSGPQYIYSSIEALVLKEREEGTFSKGMPLDIQVCLVISGLAGFWVYQKRCGGPLDREKKEFFYKCLMKNLSAEYEE